MHQGLRDRRASGWTSTRSMAAQKVETVNFKGCAVEFTLDVVTERS